MKTFWRELMLELGTLREDREVSACCEGVTPPQKLSLLLLEQSPGCIHEENIFLHLWREAFCPKAFTDWRSPLPGTMATLPSHVYPKSPVTDALLRSANYGINVKDDVCLHCLALFFLSIFFFFFNFKQQKPHKH